MVTEMQTLSLLLDQRAFKSYPIKFCKHNFPTCLGSSLIIPQTGLNYQAYILSIRIIRKLTFTLFTFFVFIENAPIINYKE